MSDSEMLLTLLRSSGFVAVSAVIVWSLLKLLRIESIRVHSMAWLIVLLQGVVLLSVEVELPVLRSVSKAVPTADSNARESAIKLPLETAPRVVLHPESVPVEPHSADTILSEPSLAEVRSLEQIASIDSPASVWTVRRIVLVIWLVGCIATVGVMLISYLRFLRCLNAQQRPAVEDWSRQWNVIQHDVQLASQIDLQVTRNLGPAICWTPSGYRLLVPETAWALLSVTQRDAILRHELAHYQRHDLRNALVFRLIAAVHWFNPFAWLAVRRLAECAEWACDESVRRFNATNSADYVRALMQLSTAPQRIPNIIPAASGHSLICRAKRLLTPNLKEDHGMKKLTMLLTGMALVTMNIMSFELVAAQETNPNTIPQEDVQGDVPPTVVGVTFVDSGTVAIIEEAGPDDVESNVVGANDVDIVQPGIDIRNFLAAAPTATNIIAVESASTETAVIDMAYIFQNLPQFQAAKDKLNKDVREQDAQKKKEAKAILALQQKMKSLTGVEQAELKGRYFERKVRLESDIRLTREKLQQEESRSYLSCYKLVLKAVADHAKENGIRIVRRSTMQREQKKKLESGDPTAIIQAMNQAIVYVADEELDITDEVLERLKSEYSKEQKSKPPRQSSVPVSLDITVPSPEKNPNVKRFNLSRVR